MIIRSLILSLVLTSFVDARPRLIRPTSTPTAPVELEVIQEEVDVAQVMRLGDCVQHCDGLHRAAPTDTESFVELMASVPPDDLHKWFVSVVGDGGAESRILREQWKTEPHLLALADPSESKNSWAHINFYDSRDGSQQFRFENVQFTHFPTVIVQPPRSKEYGDPSTVVYQSSYSGDPHHLSTNISQAIQFYVGKLDQRPGYDSFRAQTPDEDVESSDENIGADPPWDVPPAESDGRRRILFPDGLPIIPPREGIETVFKIPWGLIITALTGGASVPVFIGLGIWLVRQIRARRKADGKKLILDDETLERIFDVLETLSQPKVDEEEEEEEKPAVAKKRKKTRRR